MLSGNNSAPQKATEAAQKDAIAGAKDEIAMEVQEALLNYYNNTYVEGDGTKENSIQEVVSGAASTAVGNATSRNKQLLPDSGVSDNTITLKTKSYTVTGTIDENGGITWSDTVARVKPNDNKNVVTKEDIISNPEKYIGMEVSNYTCESDAVDVWKILYADNENVYLIASDFIKYYDVPKLNGESVVYEGYEEGGIYLDYSKFDYQDLKKINNDKLKKLNKSFFDFISINGNFDSYFSSEDSYYQSYLKQIGSMSAFLLNTTFWNSFSGDNADFAIGGPTIELILNSYNLIYDTNYSVKFNENGYIINAEGNFIKFPEEINPVFYATGDWKETFFTLTPSVTRYESKGSVIITGKWRNWPGQILIWIVVA